VLKFCFKEECGSCGHFEPLLTGTSVWGLVTLSLVSQIRQWTIAHFVYRTL